MAGARTGVHTKANHVPRACFGDLKQFDVPFCWLGGIERLETYTTSAKSENKMKSMHVENFPTLPARSSLRAAMPVDLKQDMTLQDFTEPLNIAKD